MKVMRNILRLFSVVFISTLSISSAHAQQVLETWSVNGLPDEIRILRNYADGPGPGAYVTNAGLPGTSVARFRSGARAYPITHAVCTPFASLNIAHSTRLTRNGVEIGKIIECEDIWSVTIEPFLVVPGQAAMPLTRLP